MSYVGASRLRRRAAEATEESTDSKERRCEIIADRRAIAAPAPDPELGFQPDSNRVEDDVSARLVEVRIAIEVSVPESPPKQVIRSAVSVVEADGITPV